MSFRALPLERCQFVPIEMKRGNSGNNGSKTSNNKKQASDSMFISGSIDLSKFILHLYEIIGEEKFTNEDIAYIESEFNNIVLSTGYESLFDFSNIKELKAILDVVDASLYFSRLDVINYNFEIAKKFYSCNDVVKRLTTRISNDIYSK